MKRKRPPKIRFFRARCPQCGSGDTKLDINALGWPVGGGSLRRCVGKLSLPGLRPQCVRRSWSALMAVLKPFDGSVYYVGSDVGFSYFRSGTVFYSRYKTRTSELKLARTFPFGKGEPYAVTLLHFARSRQARFASMPGSNL